MEPMTTPSATLDTSSQPACLRITGDWTLAHYASLKRESERLRAQYAADTVADLSQLGRLDTAGASLLAELLAAPGISMRVDLQAQTVTGPRGRATHFVIDSFPRQCLLQGLDEIDYTLTQLQRIEDFERRREADPALFI